MAKKINESWSNYTCTIIKLPAKQSVQGLDNLVRVTVFGNDCLIGKDSPIDILYAFFPSGSVLNNEFLKFNNLFRDYTLNNDPEKRGFFSQTGKVSSQRFKGVISTGFVCPLEFIINFLESKDIKENFKEGDEFNTIDNIILSYKFSNNSSKEVKNNSSIKSPKTKKESRLIANQFKFHKNTSHFLKNTHSIQPEDEIVITDKLHGTSAVFSNILTKRRLSLKEKIAKFFGVKVVEKEYFNLYSSRTVVKNQYFDNRNTLGYYNIDIWGIVNEKLKDIIEEQITLYGEIVGYLPSGAYIQKGYDYGCLYGEHEFYVYRITLTKSDGSVLEFTWKQVKEYCNKYGIKFVPERFSGKAKDLFKFIPITDLHWNEFFASNLQEAFLEGDCPYCTSNIVPFEGVCIRKEEYPYDIFKLKSKRFTLRESNEQDLGEKNIEDDESEKNNSI